MFGWPSHRSAPRPHYQGYAAATRWRPEWTPAFLVFQAGVPRAKASSITGSGQVYGREFQAMNTPLVAKANSPGFYSLTGGGQIPYDPATIDALLGGRLGVGP